MRNAEASAKEKQLSEVIVELETALLEYAVQYGLSDQARAVLTKSGKLLATLNPLGIKPEGASRLD